MTAPAHAAEDTKRTQRRALRGWSAAVLELASMRFGTDRRCGSVNRHGRQVTNLRDLL